MTLSSIIIVLLRVLLETGSVFITNVFSLYDSYTVGRSETAIRQRTSEMVSRVSPVRRLPPLYLLWGEPGGGLETLTARQRHLPPTCRPNAQQFYRSLPKRGAGLGANTCASYNVRYSYLSCTWETFIIARIFLLPRTPDAVNCNNDLPATTRKRENNAL